MNEIGMGLKKISNHMDRRRNRDLKAYGLTGTQLEILEYLHYREGNECVLSGIAAFFDVKHTSVLHVVKILEKKELVRREEKKQGSRFGRICLTQKGQAIMDELEVKKSEIDKVMLHGMTGEEQLILQSLLQKVYHNLKRTEEGGPEDSLLPGKELDDEGSDNRNL